MKLKIYQNSVQDLTFTTHQRKLQMVGTTSVFFISQGGCRDLAQILKDGYSLQTISMAYCLCTFREQFMNGVCLFDCL